MRGVHGSLLARDRHDPRPAAASHGEGPDRSRSVGRMLGWFYRTAVNQLSTRTPRISEEIVNKGNTGAFHYRREGRRNPRRATKGHEERRGRETNAPK